MLALREGARGGGGNKQRARTMLVMFEVMVSVALLASSGLLVRAMWRLQAIDPGFSTDGILTLRTALPMPGVRDRARGDRAFYTQVLDDIRALPGVSSAAFITGLPMAMGGGIWPVIINGHGVDSRRSELGELSHGHAALLLDDAHSHPPRPRRRRDRRHDAHVRRRRQRIVREAILAERGSDRQAIHVRVQGANGGRRRRRHSRARARADRASRRCTCRTARCPTAGSIYYSPKDLVVRSSIAAGALLPEIRRIVRRADPQQPMSNVATWSKSSPNETASRLAQLRVLGVLAGIALLLAGVGSARTVVVHRLESHAGDRRARGARRAA